MSEIAADGGRDGLADLVARNLRRHCANAESISQVCRLASLNRQQFAKYLAGDHLPSLPTLDRIALALGVPLAALLETGERQPAPRRDLHALLATMVVDDPPLFREGHYLEVMPADLAGTRFNVALSAILRTDAGFRYHRKTVIIEEGRRRRRDHVGFVFNTRPLLSIVYGARDRVGSSALMHLYATGRSASTLIGARHAVSGRMMPRPYMAPVVLSHLGEQPDLRRNLRRCGHVSADAAVDDDLADAIATAVQLRQFNEISTSSGGRWGA